MKTLEVRCCCDPGVIRGHVHVPDHLCVLGTKVRFALGITFAQAAAGEAMETAELEVAELFDHATGSRRLALKSRDLPMDVLRRIGDFREYAGERHW